MEHKSVDELRRVAVIETAPHRPVTTRHERLERWADVLNREPHRLLTSLEEIEWRPRAERPLMRAENSALSVAFEDPLLRAAGLAGDRLGDAMAFFELSEMEAHQLLCSCLNGRTIQAGAAAHRVRGISQQNTWQPWTAFALASAAASVPVLLYLLT